MRWSILLVVLMLAPAQAAEFGGFGHRVAQDPAVSVLTFSGHDFVFLDADGDGLLDRGEAIVVSAGSTLGANDVWIGGDDAGAYGSRTGAAGGNVIASGFTLAYVDVQGDGSFGPQDLLVLDSTGSESGTLSGNDMMLNGANAGMYADSQAVGFNGPTQSFSVSIGFVDLDGDGAAGGDEPLYLDTNEDEVASTGDLRLTPAFGNPAGVLVSVWDNDAAPALSDADGPVSWGMLDSDDDGVLDDEDPAYLGRSTDRTAGGTIRLLRPAVGEPGGQVVPGDPDSSRTMTSLPGVLSMTGGDSGPLTEGAVLVFDVDGDGRASAQDILLSGDAAGTTAGAGSISGAALISASGSLRYLDLDLDDRFGVGDVAFYDGDGDGFVGAGDVQLTVDPAGRPATSTSTSPSSTTTYTTPVVQPTTSTSATSTPASSTTETVTETGTETVTTTETSKGSPPIALGFVLIGLVLLSRRV